MTIEEEKFVETCFGWITPDGKLIPCNSRNHKQALINRMGRVKDELGKEFREWTKKEEEEIEAIRKGCIELEKDEGFGEWHSYEMASDSLDSKIVDWAYHKGFLRLGKYNNTICVEGTEEGISKNYYVAKELVDLVGSLTGKKMDLEIEKQKVFYVWKKR